jgi:hypothetical protein
MLMGDLDDPAIDDRHVAARQIGARTAELQGTGETGKAAARHPAGSAAGRTASRS